MSTAVTLNLMVIDYSNSVRCLFIILLCGGFDGESCFDISL